MSIRALQLDPISEEEEDKDFEEEQEKDNSKE